MQKYRTDIKIRISLSSGHFYSSRNKNVHQFKRTEISHVRLIDFEPLIELKLHTNVEIITFRNLLSALNRIFIIFKWNLKLQVHFIV